MQALVLQHGDFFENLSVAAATVLREGFAADEELRVFLCLYYRWRFLAIWVFFRTPAFFL